MEKSKIEFSVKKEQIEEENYHLDITLKEFIKNIKTNVHEFDSKNRDIDTLALITFRESKHTMDGVLNRDNHNIRKGCCNAIVCNIAFLLRCNLSEAEIFGRIVNAVERQMNKIRMLRDGANQPLYFWKVLDWNTLTVRELIIEVKNNTYSFDSTKTLGNLALVVFRQDGKTVKGIDEDYVLMTRGIANAIVCNISLLVKSYLEDEENQKKLEGEVIDEIIKRLIRAINQQAEKIKIYEKNKKFFK
jgi:hypothetical protein